MRVCAERESKMNKECMRKNKTNKVNDQLNDYVYAQVSGMVCLLLLLLNNFNGVTP